MDFSSVKAITIPEGEATKITVGDTVLWEKVTYTNLATTVTLGYRLRSTGGTTTATEGDACAVVEDYIPISKGDVVRVKGFGAMLDYPCCVYQPNKASYSAAKANAQASVLTYSYDATSGVVTLTSLYQQDGYLRVCGILAGTKDDVIVTLNQEIT